MGSWNTEATIQLARLLHSVLSQILSNEAVRLALAMGEVVHRAGTAFLFFRHAYYQIWILVRSQALSFLILPSNNVIRGNSPFPGNQEARNKWLNFKIIT